MKKKFDLWDEVECASFILNKLNNNLDGKLHTETILILLYKKHEYETHRNNISRIEDPLNELKNITFESNLFPTQKEFLNKLGISKDDEFLKNIIHFESEYNDLFDWTEFEEEIGSETNSES